MYDAMIVKARCGGAPLAADVERGQREVRNAA